MAYQPTFPSPYLTSIDVNRPETCVLSCVINPRDEVSAYYVRICEAESGLVVGNIKGWVSSGVFTKGVRVENLTEPRDYPFLPNSTSYKTVGISKYDTTLPLKSPNLFISIPSELINIMSNGKAYVWKLGITTKKRDMYKLCEGSVAISSQTLNDGKFSLIAVKERFEDTFNAKYCNACYLKYKSNFYYIEKFSDSLSGYGYDKYSGISIDEPIDYYKGDSYEVYTCNVHSQDFYFYALSAPKLQFINPPDVVISFSHTFNASYSVVDNQKINYYTFRLYSDGTLIDDTDKTYSSNIQYAYDKFEREKTYELELEVEDEYGNLESISHSFRVEYPINTIPIESKTFCDKSGFVNIDYSDLVSINGRGENYEYIGEESVSIAKDGYVMWDKTAGGKNIQIPYDSTTILKVHFHNVFKGDVFSIYDLENVGDRIRIWFEDGYFYWQNGYSNPASIFAYASEESAIKDTASLDNGTIVVSDDIRYIIDGDDKIEATDDITIIANDSLVHYWWYIFVRPSSTNNIVKIIRGEAY